MDTATFLDNFDTIAFSPGGVARLRELVLDLAVRGRLVPPDANDEPVSRLLQRIGAERQRRVGAKESRPSKPMPPIAEGEAPFGPPKGWQNVRLGEVVEIVRGITFPASAKQTAPGEGLIACLRTTNVQETLDWHDLLYIPVEYVKHDSQLVRANDIIISMANSRALVGKVALNERPDAIAAFGGFVSAIRPVEIEPRFLMAVLRVPSARDRLIDSATQTTNIANISLGRLNPLVIGLPPLDEQRRIAEQVDELMGLCDELERRLRDRERVAERLASAAITAMAAAAS